MDVGALVWVQDLTDSLVWVSAQITSVGSSGVTVQLQSTGRQLDIPLLLAANGECRNVLLQNQNEELSEQSDLVTLPHLHEASILHALRLRYARDAIYTRIGEILISINPFKKLPALYTRQNVDAYAPFTASDSGASTETLQPHLFAIARAAYVDVVRNGRNQSILISGESGAGKTEATKIMMKYFAETCGTKTILTTEETQTTTSIETQVLQSNPILEAFGNARTVRNDNSSRFGKFIELQFDQAPRHGIVGARIRTYLLEKIRVISQAPHERNFHVFYELIAVASAPQPTLASVAAAAPAWKLHSANDFRILNQSGCFTRRDGVQDASQFERTHRAMQQIGLRDDEIVDVLSVVAALLHMGNIAFTQRQSAAQNVQEAIIQAGDEPFGTAAALLRVAPEQLAFAVTKRKLTTATETLTVALDATQAEHTRNALVMECYRLLFAWLVGKINSKIHYGGTDSKVDCIGLLDIFGFEDMAVNSFEQLCINYANEALQHQFNGFVFDEEQKLYRDEGIAWTFVDFPNNSACLELFERKPMGLFALADQECLFPQGTDRALLAKLYAEFEKKQAHAHFLPPTSGWQRQSHFVVAHYAGKVSYAVDGFLAKNKDSFCETAATLLATSSNSLIQSLSLSHPSLPAATATPADGAGRKTAKSTLQAVSVGSQFKLQLNDLLELIRATAPHYVRCIKPNDKNVSDTFHAPRIVEQLRSGGVLEAVRVARDGFPVRMSHAQFLERYQRVLLFQAAQKTSRATPPRQLLERCLAQLSTVVASAATGVSLGKTRVFFRRQPYEQLEQFRAKATVRAATLIQKTLRGYGARHRFRRLRVAVLHLQSLFRGGKARGVVTWLRQTLRATLVQKSVRRWLVRRRYLSFHASVVACQTHFRRRQATRRVQALREQRAASRLVTFWRCQRDRRRYDALRRSVLTLQCAVRRRAAKKRLLALRMESRNVAKLQQDNLQLQAELAMLRMQLLSIQTNHTPSDAASIRQKLLTLPGPEVAQRSPVLQPRGPEIQWKEQRYTDNNQRITLLVEPLESLKTSSLPPLSVDLSNDRSPHKVKLVAPHSVLPPPAPSQRRSSSGASSMASAAAASMTKAELFSQPPPRNRSRSSQNVRHWHDQHDALDAKVKQLRAELKEAATASNPEEEQEQIVKRFVTAQMRASSSRLQHRHSGSFGLELPEDCDNNSAVDDEEEEDANTTDEDPSHENEATPKERQPSMRLPSHKLLVAPMTACAPGSRFTWNSASSSATSTDAPLSARLPPQSSRAGQRPRFFGDMVSGLSAFDFQDVASQSSRSSAFSGASSVTSGSMMGPPGSVPRWCKDTMCKACQCKFTFLTRRHHCRSCGNSFCFEHSTRRMLLPELGYAGDAQRVCDDCFEWRLRESHSSGGSGRLAEVLQRSESLASVTTSTASPSSSMRQVAA